MVYQHIHICHVIVSNRYGSNVTKILIDVILKDKNVLYRCFFIYLYLVIFLKYFFYLAFNLFYQ